MEPMEMEEDDAADGYDVDNELDENFKVDLIS